MEENLHNIFITDPIDLKNNVNRQVKILLDDTEVIKGTVYTIDPVSQSVLLITTDETGKHSLVIILKHSISAVEILPELPEDKSITDLDIFKFEKTLTLQKNIKEDVKKWLLKNMINVTECDDKLIIDTCEIHPPYSADNCFCPNSIVLSRIQTLLKQMPFQSS